MIGNRTLLMGVLLAPAADPTFSANAAATTRRQKDYLEIAFAPAEGSTPAVFARVPLVSELGGFQPQSNTNRKPLYVDAEGQLRTLVAIIKEGGSIQFSLASTDLDPTFRKLLAAANKGAAVLYKAHYASTGVTIQGEAALQDRGQQGAANDIPDWGFTLEAISAAYIDSKGELIV